MQGFDLVGPDPAPGRGVRFVDDSLAGAPLKRKTPPKRVEEPRVVVSAGLFGFSRMREEP